MTFHSETKHCLDLRGFFFTLVWRLKVSPVPAYPVTFSMLSLAVYHFNDVCPQLEPRVSAHHLPLHGGLFLSRIRPGADLQAVRVADERPGG